MAKRPNNITQPSKFSAFIQTSRYVDPKTDFSFKHFFGKEPHKDLLMDFLNGLFKGRKVIKELSYSNIEHQGVLPVYRKTVFDLYCTGDKGEKFVVEIQQAGRDFFKDRIIFYTANLIQEQGTSVNAKWNYELPEVYFVAIMDFCFDNSHPDHYVHDVRLLEVNTNIQFYDKLGYLFVELPKFNKTATELETKEDNWLFSLRNMNKLKEIPVSLRENEIFKKLFDIAEVGNLNHEEMNAYQESLKVQRDNYSLIETVEKRVEKRERTRALEEKRIIAIKLKTKGMSVPEVAELTSLSVEEIEALTS